MSRTEWMKGICFLWSRGRHFPPSLPGNRYLKLASQKRSPGRNLGEQRLVRRSGTTSRSTALMVLCLRMHSSPSSEFLTISAARYPRRTPGARFSKVPKLFGRVSGDIILFVSSKQRRLEARNFAVILSSIPFTTYQKTGFTE